MHCFDIPEFQSIPAMVAHEETPASMIVYRTLGYNY